jgi:hypothetical protein
MSGKRVRRVIVVDGWQLMWVRRCEASDGSRHREWKAAEITDEMVERGAGGLAAERISSGYRDDAEACLRAALSENGGES